jgi:hypothetical protein
LEADWPTKIFLCENKRRIDKILQIYRDSTIVWYLKIKKSTVAKSCNSFKD